MKIRATATAALALTAALTLVGCATGSGAGSEPMPGMNHGQDSPSQTSRGDFNNADVMFATMMIPHHEQAVEMADMILAEEGVDERVRALAEDIKAAQQPEIDEMRQWLDAWGVGHGAPGADMGHGGMMSDDDMDALEAATGAAAARLFLEQMIVHHEGAIDMAQAEVDDGRNPDAVEMARTIVDTQTAEVAVMQGLLDEI